MKTLIQTAIAASAFVATAAFATPQYYGDTTASVDFGSNNTTSNSNFDFTGYDVMGDGYYIWNDEDDTSTWYIVWTSETYETWTGEIDFFNTSTGTISELSWNTDDISDVDYSAITEEYGTYEYLTFTNSGGYDGITFTVSDSYELIELSLGSSLFEDLEVSADSATDPGVDSYGIYIGSEYSTDFTVLTDTYANGITYQQFEIFVPEPATMALFGLGIAGLAASRRRQKKELAA